MEDTSFLQIDRGRLDRECSKQPELYWKHAKALADAMASMEQAKSELDLVRAELVLDMNERPDKYDIPKSTVGIIESALLMQAKYNKALKKLHAVKHEVDICSAVVKALDHKKRALESLVSLHGQNYFSEPRNSKEDREKLGEASKDRIRRLGRRASEDDDEG